MRRLAALAVLAACLVPATGASAAVRNFPGSCGATLAACIASSPAGTTIQLRTNALIPIPDVLDIPKALKLEPAPGFKPKIGRTGTPALLRFTVTATTGGVSIRGITFRQVSVSVNFSSGSHRTVFENNRLRLDTGSESGAGLAISYAGTSRGPVSIRGNDISSTGAPLGLVVHGGPVTVAGNVITSPVVGDSQMGLVLLAGGSGTTRAVVANNVIHHVGGCNCSLKSGLVVIAGDPGTLDVGILNNTIANVGVDPSSSANGILVYPPGASAHLKARLYNNVVANSYATGILLDGGASVEVIGDRNNVFGVPNPTVYGSHDMGTTLRRNPRFKSAADYRLKSSSRLANTGVSCVPGFPLPRADAAGRFRYFGPGLDIGAYERGSIAGGSVGGVSKTGTNAGKKMVGTKGRDVLCGLGGKDRLFGLGGSDFLFGGAGNDRLFGGAGNDRIDLRDGKRGNDAGDGGDGQDVCMRDARDRRTSC